MPAAVESQSSKPPRCYAAGDVIAEKYRLVRVLGAGGMGQVWEAWNMLLDAPVAIKLIPSSVDGAAAAARLVREARAAARLQHPSIVRVFDVGETAYADPFIVMERLSGESLADVLSLQRRLPATRAVQILLPIADALVLAHSKGVVHRDVKPENIFLARDESGRIQSKLLDFGVVRFDSGADHRNLTQSGAVVGSPSYLSPEQARGIAYDHRVDVWAFCVVLYELVAGDAPFVGDNYHALLRSIIEDEPKPTVDVAAGDHALWDIIQCGLRKSMDERWPSMRELGRALAEWAYAQGVDEDIFGTGLEAKWLLTGDAAQAAEVGSFDGARSSYLGATGRRRSRPVTKDETLASRAPAARNKAHWAPAAAAALLLVVVAAYAWWRPSASASSPSALSARPATERREPVAPPDREKTVEGKTAQDDVSGASTRAAAASAPRQQAPSARVSPASVAAPSVASVKASRPPGPPSSNAGRPAPSATHKAAKPSEPRRQPLVEKAAAPAAVKERADGLDLKAPY